jgi:hypothetical protein
MGVHAILRHMLRVTVLEGELAVAVSQHFGTLLLVFKSLLLLFEGLFSSKLIS